MSKHTRYVGLDVHLESITVAVAESGRGGEVRSLGHIPNNKTSLRKLVKKLGGPEGLRVCYEAGPMGYTLYWQLTELGVDCQVVAPTLIPTKPGDRVKTDRRDAEKLARCHRAGDLTPVYVPSLEHEALRDLVRCRAAAKSDQTRARNRLGKFLLRHDRRRPAGCQSWGVKHIAWLRSLSFELSAHRSVFSDLMAEVEHAAERVASLERSIDEAIEQLDETSQEVIAALQALRGVAKLTAVSVVAELGRLSRFSHPSELMGYSGAVPSEHSTGGPGKARRGGITKTGNSHLRKLVVESAWSYRYKPAVRGRLKKRQEGLDPQVKEVAWKAQKRLHERYMRLSARGKEKPKVVVAVGRELLGFIWDIGVRVERAAEQGGVR